MHTLQLLLEATAPLKVGTFSRKRISSFTKAQGAGLARCAKSLLSGCRACGGFDAQSQMLVDFAGFLAGALDGIDFKSQCPNVS